jgi:hypothetical protein
MCAQILALLPRVGRWGSVAINTTFGGTFSPFDGPKRHCHASRLTAPQKLGSFQGEDFALLLSSGACPRKGPSRRFGFPIRGPHDF